MDAEARRHASRVPFFRLRAAALIAVCAAVLVAGFELAWQLWRPTSDAWVSSLWRVAYAMFLSGAGSCWVLRRFDVVRLQGVDGDLAETRARERSVLDAAVDGIITIDESGRIESVNPATVRMFGYQIAELRGANISVLMAPPHREAHQGYLRRYLETGEARIIGIGREVEARRKDGSLFPIELAVSEAVVGQRRWFTGIVRDITDRRRAAELGQILESSLHEIYLFDARGLRFVHVNRGGRENLGYTLSQLREMTPVDLEPGQTRDALEALLEPLRSGAQPRVEFRTLYERSDGSRYRVDVHLQHVEFAGASVFAALVQDVTEREELETQLVQAQKMEAIGQLAGGIAHDFNNLLTSIQGSGELLASRLSDEDRSQRAVRRIQQAAERGAALTQHLLAFSRRQPAEPRSVDLNASVSEMAELTRRLIGDDIDVELDLEPDLDRVEADPTQLDQIVMNLVVNAGDAMPGGGHLILQTRGVELDAAAAQRLGTRPGRAVCLSVRDDGVGMDEHTRGHIFEPFFTTKEVGKGTGLGLSTVYGIVTQSGWGIEVESAAGQGSCFRVYLAGGAAAAKDAGAPPAARRGTRSGSILLVEDDALLRDMLSEVLEGAGYRVLAASGPAAALERVRADAPALDLLVSDVIMPEMTGPQLASQLRELAPELRVLLMSGYSDGALAERGIQPAEGTLVRKPFENEQLLERVASLLHPPDPPPA